MASHLHGSRRTRAGTRLYLYPSDVSRPRRGHGETLIAEVQTKAILVRWHQENQTKVSAWGKTTKLKQVTLPRLHIRESEFSSVAALICELPSVGGVRLDGLLGLDLLKRSSVTIDFEAGTVLFGPGSPLGNSTQFYPGLPFVPVFVSIQDRRYGFKLDTAAFGLVLYEETLGDHFPALKTGKVELGNSRRWAGRIRAGGLTPGQNRRPRVAQAARLHREWLLGLRPRGWKPRCRFAGSEAPATGL